MRIASQTMTGHVPVVLPPVPLPRTAGESVCSVFWPPCFGDWCWVHAVPSQIRVQGSADQDYQSWQHPLLLHKDLSEVVGFFELIPLDVTSYYAAWSPNVV